MITDNDNILTLNNKENNNKLTIVNDELIISKLLKNIIINDDFESISEEYSCNICCEIIYKKEPLQCKEGHIACKNCFEQHLSRKKECMVCNLEIKSIIELGRVRFIEELLSKKKIKCPYSYYVSIFNQDISSNEQCDFESTYKDNNGCGEVIKIGELESHLNNCNSRFIKCSNNNNGCKEVIRFKSLNNHLNNCIFTYINCSFCFSQLQRHQLTSHLDICPSVEVLCHQCSNHFKRREINKHVESDCPDTIIQCDYNEYGCTVQFKRSDLEWHYVKINHTKYMTKMIQQQSKQIIESNNQIKQLKEILLQKDQHLNLYKDEISNLNTSISNIKEEHLIHLNLYKNEISNLNTLVSNINGILSKNEVELNQYKHQLSNINDTITSINSNIYSKYKNRLNSTIYLKWKITSFFEKNRHLSDTFKYDNIELYLELIRKEDSNLKTTVLELFLHSKQNFDNVFDIKVNRVIFREEKNDIIENIKTKETAIGTFYAGPFLLNIEDVDLLRFVKPYLVPKFSIFDRSSFYFNFKLYPNKTPIYI